ncbi:4,5:9,10-diseco-3-hydroxy-5,9,17-trioxoandrosta-1(10),2-diene-4-oate hydrolase [Nocardia cerradoensis]|uniref:4,5:9,10-diseco-3-hydroxy-5,9, 17-trioxoandrosta-1(10),2-diene-4-oate hydrolase n=1 Tax=Nocardia cerradoensis TaxID=85688 RepID=A0A231GX67_9NOCA|nr:alpha/beta hydrolase [Nocardia cerradoensis]OXR41207.1 4,5:9,10-diseco-3-hydroxy-5,9,17-trioxoandrosta-1(10),2-diene-4-oate hydrolase [Nocardia cerradoensis]
MAPLQTPVITTTERVYDGYRTSELSCPGAGPTIILLHGILDLPQTWSQVLERLAAAGHRAVAMSLPQPHEQPIGTPVVPRQDEFVAAVIRAHAGSEGVVLVGNSMGGGLALRAAANPDLPVRAVVALDPIGFGTSRWISGLFVSRRVPEYLHDPIDLIRSLLRALVAPMVARVVFARSGDPVTTHARAVAAQLATIPIGLVLAGARALLTEFADGYSALPAVPVLFVHGRRDKLIPVRASILGHHQIRGSELRILPNAGHCPQVDEPQVVSDLIVEFTTRVARAA